MRVNPLWIAMVLAACGSQQPGDDAADARTGEHPAGRYLPRAVGASWVLFESDPVTGASGNRTTTVEAYEEVGPSHPGKRAYRVRVEKLFATTLYWEGVEGDVTVRYRHEDYDLAGVLSSRVVNRPYRIKLDESPARLITGATYADAYTTTTTDATGTSVKLEEDRWQVIASHEAVIVPMGRFDDALHVRRIGNQSGSKQKDYWYVRGVGKVKESGGDRQEEELLSYTAGP